MRRLTVAVMVVSLAAAGTSATLAQSPSPSAGSTGQRVEVLEHGFAVRLPEGWLALDPAEDGDEQSWVTVMGFDTLATADEVRHFSEVMTRAKSEGMQLVLTDGASSCLIAAKAKRAIETGEFADQLASAMSSDDRFMDVEPPRAIELPAGPSFVISATHDLPHDALGPIPAVTYLIDSDASVVFASCTGPERPADDWLSVFQTFEFLPEEDPAPPPWFGGRVEMLEHGLALALPDEWVGIDMAADIDRQLTIAVESPDLEGIWVYKPDLRAAVARSEGVGDWLVIIDAITTNSCGLLGVEGLVEETPGTIGEVMLERLAADDTVTDIQPLEVVDLPVGSAVRFSFAVADPFRPYHSGPATVYIIGGDARLLWATCSAPRDRPGDQWLSIAETIEFLPAEE